MVSRSFVVVSIVVRSSFTSSVVLGSIVAIFIFVVDDELLVVSIFALKRIKSSKKTAIFINTKFTEN